MTLDAFLKEMGYGPEHDHPIYRKDGVKSWYKKVQGTERHQYVLNMWPSVFNGSRPTFELEMCYETRGGIWAETKYYGLSFDQLLENLTRLESCLKQSLLYMDANPLHYEYDGG